MREILFRGKRLDNNEWIYGFYHNETSIESSASERKRTMHHIYTQNFDKFIDGETLGQYTGIKDKNGTKIFEGDIFEEENEIRGVVVFENGAFKIQWYGYQTVLKEYGYDDGCWDILETESFDAYYVDKMEVIGNRYDNPELLEGVC